MNSREQEKNTKKNSIIETIKKYQPVHWTGSCMHMAPWLFSNTKGYSYENEKILNLNKKEDNGDSENFTTSSSSEQLLDMQSQIVYQRRDSETDSVGIYCVHGTADRANAFKVFVERLLPKLPDYIDSIKLLSFDERFKGTDIDNYAKQLKNKIKHKNAILFGHSRGALISSKCAVDMKEEDGKRILAVFSFGGPYGGSPLAIWPINLSKSVKQMRYNSDGKNTYLNELSQKIVESGIPHYYHGACMDAIVPISSCYVPEQSENLLLYRRHSHLSLLHSQKIVDDVLARLNGKDFVLSITSILAEIKQFITTELDDRYHLFKSTPKKDIFTKLYELLKDINEGKNDNRYPEVKTIAEFIEAFISDEEILPSKKKPMAVLDQQLNILSYSALTASRFFVQSLIIRYKNIPLTAESNEKQNQLQNF